MLTPLLSTWAPCPAAQLANQRRMVGTIMRPVNKLGMEQAVYIAQPQPGMGPAAIPQGQAQLLPIKTTAQAPMRVLDYGGMAQAAAVALQGLSLDSPRSINSINSNKEQQPQQQQAKDAAGMSNLAPAAGSSTSAMKQLPLVLQVFMPENLAPEQQLSWWYLDDFRQIQGPFSPEAMARWYINDGLREDLMVCGTLGQGMAADKVKHEWLARLAHIFKQVSQGKPYTAPDVAPQEQAAGVGASGDSSGLFTLIHSSQLATDDETSQAFVPVDSSKGQLWLPPTSSMAGQGSNGW
jgi:hypothetical protein